MSRVVLALQILQPKQDLQPRKTKERAREIEKERMRGRYLYIDNYLGRQNRDKTTKQYKGRDRQIDRQIDREREREREREGEREKER